MREFLQTPFQIGGLSFPNRLIQGPLAGFSAAPMRQLYYQFSPPAYCVSEMISAHDLIHKHRSNSRYLYRGIQETRLCYQLSGHDPHIMREAALRLEGLGADLIDLNCGCPKTKIRKKGAGSALLDNLDTLCAIVSALREAICIPLTVKLRIHGDECDTILAKAIEQAGADALIIHGRRWTDSYDTPCNIHQIAKIKQSLSIPVIANGDLTDQETLNNAIALSGCDAYMIARAGCGQPWLYQYLLAGKKPDSDASLTYFMFHLEGLAQLEGTHRAILQSKSLVRYYFRNRLNRQQMQAFYALDSLNEIRQYLGNILSVTSL